MMRVFMALSISLIAGSILILADDHSVDVDSHADFSTYKTFAFHNSSVQSPRPELNNPLLLKKIAEAIRMELTAKGMKETAEKPDVLVNYSIAAVDYSIGPGGRANVVGGRGPRGGPNAPPQAASGQASDFSESTLVIDLTTRDPDTLIWHGVYRDEEKNNGKLAEKLPGDAKKLFSEFPPKKKS